MSEARARLPAHRIEVQGIEVYRVEVRGTARVRKGGAMVSGITAARNWLQVLLDGPARRAGPSVATAPRANRLTHTRVLPARAGETASWPEWADDGVVGAYQARGIAAPWQHQVAAANDIWAGHNVCIATSTGSGKSLAFWLPAFTAIRAGIRARSHRSAIQGGDESAPATVLYVAPTKALAADQRASLERLLTQLPAADAPHGRRIIVATCDGDTPAAERKWIQDYADVVLTNPDFLHFSMLPGHRSWARFLRALRLVIVDEGHAYRGVFGAHVSLILRRLQRLAEHYRSRWSPTEAATSAPPQFVVASATSADPTASAARLIGTSADQVVAITDDAAPAGERTIALWLPPELPSLHPREPERPTPAETKESDWDAAQAWLLNPLDLADPFELLAVVPPAGLNQKPPTGTDAPPSNDAPPSHGATAARRTATAEVAELLTDLTEAGAQTLAFTRSRRGAEAVAASTRERLKKTDPQTTAEVAAYRGGYLPEERRILERGLRSGQLRALATTNALELGVDISGLDAVLMAGWPGTRISWWQQAGRAGRAGSDGLVVFVAREDPLDMYLVTHPEALLDAPIEATVFDPGNPYVLGGQLCAAAQELPLRTADLPRFGDVVQVKAVLAELVEGGALRRRSSGWYWTHPSSAADLSDLRGTGGAPVRVVDQTTGRILGTVDAGSADGQVHAGAVYVHQGATFVVTELDLADRLAMVKPQIVDHGTWSRELLSLEIVTTDAESNWGPVHWGFGHLEVTSQVVSFERRRLPDLQVLGTEPLDLPERELATTGTWWTAPPEVLAEAGLVPAEVPGALHAAEHAMIGLLPLLATCDRWDLGGLSTDFHDDTGAATVFVYDAYPGGAGFAARGFEVKTQWLEATLAAIQGCSCEAGCPSCIQSPKCGTNNSPLNKVGAIKLLETILHYRPD